MSDISEIIEQLKKEYDIDIYFYPNMSMGIDSPNLAYEVSSIIDFLKKISLPPNLMNIFTIMKAKKECIELYNSGYLKNSALKYDENILKIAKPIGGIGPLEYFYATAIALFLTFIFAYSAGFGQEAGKLTAKKLLDDEKEQAIEALNSAKDEINFLEKETFFLSTKGEDFEIVVETIRKIKK